MALSRRANDTVEGTRRDDILFGGVGNDKINGNAGSDQIYGGYGNDTLNGGVGNDSVFGGEGDDVLTGGAGDDQVSGGAGNDILAGGGGNDIVFGDAGDDVLVFASTDVSLTSADVYDGGEGTDVLRLFFSAEMFADLTVQADLAAYQLFLDEQTLSGTQEAGSETFAFTAFDLSASGIEALEIYVDGELYLM